MRPIPDQILNLLYIYKFNLISSVYQVTCDLYFVSRLCIAKKIAAYASFRRILFSCIRIKIECTADTQAACSSIKRVSIPGRCDRVKANIVRTPRFLWIFTLFKQDSKILGTVQESNMAGILLSGYWESIENMTGLQQNIGELKPSWD